MSGEMMPLAVPAMPQKYVTSTSSGARVMRAAAETKAAMSQRNRGRLFCRLRAFSCHAHTHQPTSLTTIRTASACAATSVQGPGRSLAAATRTVIAITMTATVIRCSAERFMPPSGRDRDLARELAHLIQTLGHEQETSLQAPVEGGAGEVQPLHDHLVAADLLDVVVQEQAARFGIARLARGGQLADHVDHHRPEVGGSRAALGDARNRTQRAAAQGFWSAEVVERGAHELGA